VSDAYRIDVHHHFVPAPYIRRERERVLGAMDLNPSILTEWTPAKAVEELDRNGIATALLSISTPGIWFGENEAARTLARECNEYAAQMARDYPGRFGNFAAIPLPDVEGSLREIAYALDVLGADGIGLLSSYNDRWPGDDAFAPVFDELNRRRARVYVHPTAPACCRNLIPGVPPPVTEFLFDTTRAISSLLFSGTFSRCPEIKFIFSHGGGTTSVLAHRMAAFGERHPQVAAKLPNGARYELERLYSDVANSTNAATFGAIRSVFPFSQILFGTDWPYVPMPATTAGLPKLGLTPDELRALERGNALALFTRLATRG
jgi:predicted TIM-barrel fold metal-dependent hydrolase